MTISHRDFFKNIRDGLRGDHERRIAEGKAARLNPQLEALLFEAQDDLALTLNGAIPQAEVDLKVNELAAKGGVTPQEFKKLVVDRAK